MLNNLKFSKQGRKVAQLATKQPAIHAIQNIPAKQGEAKKVTKASQDEIKGAKNDFKAMLANAKNLDSSNEPKLNMPKTPSPFMPPQTKETKTESKNIVPQSNPQIAKMPQNSNIPNSIQQVSPNENLKQLSMDKTLESKLAAAKTLPSSPNNPFSDKPESKIESKEVIPNASLDSIAQPKKSLNDMAKVEPKETALSRVLNGANKTNAINEAPKPNALKDTKIDENPALISEASLASNAIPNALKETESKIPLDSKPFTSFASLKPESNTLNPLDSKNRDLPQNPREPLSSKNSNFKVADVLNKANELNLNPSKIEVDEEFKNSLENRVQTHARSVMENANDVKSFFSKADERELAPLFFMLESLNAKEAAKRKISNKNNKLDYIIEEKTQKIAVINRQKTLPKNITESRIKNEKQEKVFEQIHNDLAAGRELDLEKIKKDLNLVESFSENEEITFHKLLRESKGEKPLLTPSNVLKTAGGASALNSLNNSNSTPDSTHIAQNLNNKNGNNKNQDQKQGQQNQQSREAIKTENLATQLKSDKEVEGFKELANLDLDSSLENHEFEPTKNKALESKMSETKLDSKSPEAKIASAAGSASLGASALKNENLKVNPREAINSFVNQFSEEVKNYKPPLTRIQLELNPKELGSVEVTISQKGKNLSVSIASNPQAINLFAQNQNDLRANLINAGFEGVNLNFSNSGGGSGNGGFNDNQNREPQQQANEAESNEVAQNNYDSLEITLPRYA